MPNVMVAQPNIGGDLCSTPQSLADAHYQTAMLCSNTAKTRKPLKLAGVPQTDDSRLCPMYYSKMWKHKQMKTYRHNYWTDLSCCGTKFTILRDTWKRYCCFTNFFPIVDVCLNCEDTARRWCADGEFLASFWVLHFSEPRATRFRHAS